MNENKDEYKEQYFLPIRRRIAGVNEKFDTFYGTVNIHYFDWTASGRLYLPIEDEISRTFGPFVGNTHSESSETGHLMTLLYNKARKIIKDHIGATEQDILIMTGTGATGAINKLQKILGLKLSDQMKRRGLANIPYKEERPVVFITHMEHHSNQTSWLEADVEVVVVPGDERGLVSPIQLEKCLKKYGKSRMKIGSFTACSNVTGILTPVRDLAKLMHKYNGVCFVDYAAAAPYVAISMHGKNKEEDLDAIFFSPHKFLGGPGSPGVLAFKKDLYPKSIAPDHPGGGTVLWTNPWGGRRYFENPEVREDGGTPGFLQTAKAALAIKLKEQMGVKNILEREEYLLKILLEELRKIPGLYLLGDIKVPRLGIVSFYIENIHYNLLVKLLNDRYGIQVRGGCSCAGTYGHCLFNIKKEASDKIMSVLDQGDLSNKPGWIRVSLHPTLLKNEVLLLCTALNEIVKNFKIWKNDYELDKKTGEFVLIKDKKGRADKIVEDWFAKKLE